MSLEQLEEAIINQAKERIDVLHQSTQEKLREEGERIQQKSRILEEQIIDRAYKKADLEAKRISQQGRMRAREEILQAKQEELEKLEKEFLAMLLQAPKEDIKPILKNFLALIPKDEKGVIIPSETHQELLASLLKKESKHITLADTPLKNEGGFIFQGKNIDINARFSYLVRLFFTSHRSELAQILFQS